MGLLWTVFFSASKLDGHWINAAIMSRPRTLSVSGVNGGVGWPGLRLLRDDWRVCRKTASPFDWQRFCTIKSRWRWSTVAKSAYYKRLCASLFVKLREKNPWSRVAFFWAYLKKYGCLLGKSEKQLCFFIYVRRILQCIDWHAVCSQLIANQCNNIRALE